MTVKELASKMNELMRDGKGDHTATISVHKGVSFPINNIRIHEEPNYIIGQIILENTLYSKTKKID